MEMDMRKELSANRKRLKNTKPFNPNKDYLDQAVNEFLKDGGKITKIVEVEDEDLERFMAYSKPTPPGDDSFMKR